MTFGPEHAVVDDMAIVIGQLSGYLAFGWGGVS